MNTIRLERGFFAVLFVVTVYFSFLIFGPYLGVLILSGTLAILFRPVYHGILRVVRSESLAALMSIGFAAIIVFIPLAFFGVRIVSEATGLYQTLSARGGFDFSPAVHQFLAAHFPGLTIPDFTVTFNDAARAGLTWFIQNIGPLFSSIAQVLFLAFLSLFGLFYFLKDGERLMRWMVDFVPLEPTYTEQIVHETGAVMESVVKGTLVVSVVQGIVVGLGFLLFGIPNPAFWGGLTMLATLIPIVGTWFVVVPAIAYLYFTGQGVLSLGFAIWSIILVNLVFNVLSPHLMHRGGNIHPFIILLSVIGGIGAFGPIGFLVGPFIMALLFALLHVYPKLIADKK